MTSPLVLSTHDLGRQPGAMEELHRSVPAPSDLGIAVIGVPEGALIEMDIRLEAVMDGVLATTSAQAPLHGECVRCLDDLDWDTTVDFAEMYFYPGIKQQALDEGDEDAEDMREVVGEEIDLEPALRDALVTSLPFQPLCRPDCPGLCPGCGERMAELPAGHEHVERDPRWAVLEQLAHELAEDEQAHPERKDG